MTCTYCGRWFTKDTCPGCGAPRMEPPYRALTDIPASFATTHCSALRNVAAGLWDCDYPSDTYRNQVASSYAAISHRLANPDGRDR